MDEYKGFKIEEDISDTPNNFSVCIYGYGLKKVFGSMRLAKIYIDGFSDGLGYTNVK